MAAVFQPVVGTAGNDRLDQGGWVLCLAKVGHALLTIGRCQGIGGAEDALQPVAGTTAEALTLPFDRITCFAVHGGQEQFVHGDDLVEQRRLGFDQVAGDKGVAFGFGEAAQVACIVATPQLAKLAYDFWVEIIQSVGGTEQLLDQTQADDIAFDHGGIGRSRVILEPEKTGACIALRHFNQQVDRGA